MTTTTTDRRRRIAAWIAVPAAVVLSGALVAQSSYSAFSATTTSPNSNWAAGTVALTNDGNGAAAFTATDLKPGSTGSKVIAVTSTGSLPSTVKLYAVKATATKNLDSYIDLTITQGTGGSFQSSTGFTPAASNPQVYSGTLANFASNATGYATGLGPWVTSGGSAAETRTYQITYTLRTTAPSTVQGGSAGVDFTWEAQNN